MQLLATFNLAGGRHVTLSHQVPVHEVEDHVQDLRAQFTDGVQRTTGVIVSGYADDGRTFILVDMSEVVALAIALRHDDDTPANIYSVTEGRL